MSCQKQGFVSRFADMVPPCGPLVRCNSVADTEQSVMAGSVIRVVDGEWDFAYRAHAPGLLRYLRRLSRNQEIAEELMQETFGRAIRSGTAPDSTDEMRSWLYRIARISLSTNYAENGVSVSCRSVATR